MGNMGDGTALEGDTVGYVNQGPDKRAGGVLGTVLAWIQRTLSYRSPNSPKRWMTKNKNFALFWPPFLSIAIPRKGGRFFTFRAGWRWDRHWGDWSPCGQCHSCLTGSPWNCTARIVNPPPHGGFIFDFILKTRLNHRVGHGATVDD